MQYFRRAIIALLLAFLLSTGLPAQRSRIAASPDNNQRAAIAGHLHSRARAEFDQGAVDTAMQMNTLTMVLKPSASQQADLEQLLAQQQDPSSPNYHQWLTPEQYGERFGVSQSDISQLSTWLESQNLKVLSVARGRNAITFAGSAGEVQSAFRTEIHHYVVNGERHFANASNPSVPAAFADVVSAIHGLTDFRMRPPAHSIRKLQPNYDSSRGSHYQAPDDTAAIYDMQPLYSSGVDGTGQKIVVVGQSQIKLSDMEQFHSYFNLPGGDPTIVLVPNTKDPGISSGDESESDLDLELASAVARNAAITFVYTYDVMNAVQYAIDQNLAPVLSMSYGQCEPDTPASQARTLQTWAQQANAQGITWVAASGDSGGADCLGDGSRGVATLSVDMPGSIPEVTSVGGTEFLEGSGNYWSSSNNANHASVLSYIPETAWNDSVQDGSASASGGGASGYFSKPSWQTGPGVPSDGARDVPDIAFSSSADHDGYLVYTGGSLSVFGGTSVAAPVFAGITALLNQYSVSHGLQSAPGQGNVNPRLYSLAQTTPGAFHDITTGDNMVSPCQSTTRACTAANIGNSAGPGFDLVTGLGSLDVFRLVTSWSAGTSPAARSTPNVSATTASSSIGPGGSTTLTATVQGSSTTPTGTVTFTAGGSTLGTATLQGTGGTASGTLTVNASQLSAGTDTITAQYSGDGAYNGGSTTVSVTVTGSTGPPAITSLTNAASFKQVYAPGMILTVFGSNLAPGTGSAASVPLPAKLQGVTATINGVTAPFYYASPTQLNIQVPYGTATNSTATLSVNNNGQTTSATFRVTAAAPGIFTDTTGAPVPGTTAVRNQTVTLYVTGEGAVTPALATGASPASGTPTANLPKPVQSVTVNVGGVNASIQFIGITVGLAGATQINYTVPSNIAIGSVPVVVTVGGVASPAATLKVTQ